MFKKIFSKINFDICLIIGKFFEGEKYELYRWVTTGYSCFTKWNVF